jgi:formate C-acetyltransferase
MGLPGLPHARTRHFTSSQLGRSRDSLDATNHWLQNIVGGGLRPDGTDGTDPATFLLLESFRRHRMTNPLLTVRVNRVTGGALLRHTCLTLKDGGGIPALFNDEALIPALGRIGIPEVDARDYTNDGCREIIIPGRTDFRFQRLSVALCLEWALNRGRSRVGGKQAGVETGDPRQFTSFEDVWHAFETQLDAMVGSTVDRIARTLDDRSILAPVSLLSALIDGTVTARSRRTRGRNSSSSASAVPSAASAWQPVRVASMP